jgi:hypothetical protein
MMSLLPCLLHAFAVTIRRGCKRGIKPRFGMATLPPKSL